VFTPSRMNGTVCVARRRSPSGLGDVELCGYPLGHPIHKTALAERFEETRAHAVAAEGPGSDERWGQTPAEARAAALADVAELRREFDKIEWVESASTGPDTWIDIPDRIEPAPRGER
jgi:hypothetical protein